MMGKGVVASRKGEGGLLKPISKGKGEKGKSTQKRRSINRLGWVGLGWVEKVEMGNTDGERGHRCVSTSQCALFWSDRYAFSVTPQTTRFIIYTT
jgi:hypothetical protein